MTSIKELQARIDRADKLLAEGNLSASEKVRLSSLKLLDQKRIKLRQLHPDLDKPDQR